MNAQQTLLDMPYELLRGILAGSGGQGIALASCCCKRLKQLADHLMQQPIFCSAMSTQQDLNEAIKDATRRAMAGSWGRVDFALIFVANYGLPKKYTDPGDASHAVDMLKAVLCKDIPIVGCACSGIMGIGPDSQPIEVDPMCRSQLGRRAARALLLGGQAPPPTRGVSVLLGKMPAGCAVRVFASSTEPSSADGKWTEFDDALALTSSQRTQLAAELLAVAPTRSSVLATAAVSNNTPSTGADVAADGSASPATAAAATSLLSVAGCSSAVAVTNGGFRSGYGDVRAELIPQLCLMLYHSSSHGSDELQEVMDWMKAHHPGMQVVGGASSGAGDLLYSAGAVNRLAADPPASPSYVGLLICSASSDAGEAGTIAANGKQSTAAGTSASNSTNSTCRHRAAPSALSKDMVDSSRLLSIAAMSAYGLEPVPGCAVYTEAAVKLSQIDHCDMYRLCITAATQVTGTENPKIANKPGSQGAGGTAASLTATTVEDRELCRGSSTSAMAVNNEEDLEPPAQSLYAQRRSERVQQLAAAHANPSGIKLLHEELQAINVMDVDRMFLGIWRCTTASVPERFSSLEKQMVVVGMANCVLDDQSDVLEFAVVNMDQEADNPCDTLLQHDVWKHEAGTRLCVQILQHSAQGSVNMVNQGLARIKQQLRLRSYPPASPAASTGCTTSGSMADCYAAAAANAAAVGARSGLQGLAAFSCSGRGQALYSRYTDLSKASACDPNSYGALGEAALVDAAFQQGMPFAGVFCDGESGPSVKCGCLGWATQECSSVSMPQAYTSMFAAFACRPA